MKTICGRMPFSSNPNSSTIEQLIKKRGDGYQFFMTKIETRNERSVAPSFVLTIDATNDITEFVDFSNTYGVIFYTRNPDGTLGSFT